MECGVGNGKRVCRLLLVEYRTENRLWTAENRDGCVKKVDWRIESRMWNI